MLVDFRLVDWLKVFRDYGLCVRAKRQKRNKGAEVINMYCAFDIETSTVETVNIMTGITDYYSAMYVAQFAVDNIGIRFRIWQHVREFFVKFPEKLGLHKDETIVVFVHNLDYETSYLKHRLNINGKSFFGKSRQKPIKYIAENHIYFHDSYSITNSSLEMLAKMYNTKHQKTKQDIDHNKPRNFLTPLSRKEERYIFNDVFILILSVKIFFSIFFWLFFIKISFSFSFSFL
jgi:hypothetical protein